MKWYEHTCKLANSLSKKLGMLSKIKNFVSKETLKMVYNCFVQPHLIYGIQLWGATFEKGLTKIQKLQKKAICLLSGAGKMDHSEP
jgi:spore maturation protein CgeB